MIYCCVLTVYNILYKFVYTQWDGFCQITLRDLNAADSLTLRGLKAIDSLTLRGLKAIDTLH